MLDTLVAADLRDMDQTVDAVFQGNESTELGKPRDGSCMGRAGRVL